MSNDSSGNVLEAILRAIGAILGGSSNNTSPPTDSDGIGGGDTTKPRISHALVLPDRDFTSWLSAAIPYSQAFERVSLIRSPAGQDLNRYRNVTAVEAPNVWFSDDAVGHIIRAYPEVVMIDVIKAQNPEQLSTELSARIRDDDRYGVKNGDDHLTIRFKIGYPSAARPARITRTFNTDVGNGRRNEGIHCYAPAGTLISAVADGQVTNAGLNTAFGYENFVTIMSIHDGERYNITYTNLRDVGVSIGDDVKQGDAVARSATDDKFRLIVQQPDNGMNGFIIADVVNPVRLIYWQDLVLIPEDGLRVRGKPTTENSRILTEVMSTEPLRPVDSHGVVLERVGVQDKWLRVETSSGIKGYVAAWFASAFGRGEDVTDIDIPADITGVNLDINHPQGGPDPARMAGMTWLRLALNVSYDPTRPPGSQYGNTDINRAIARYQPFIDRYHDNGFKIILAFTHQTYGEGRNEFWPWSNMTENKWRQLTGPYADFIQRVASAYRGKVAAYQIWNEQDTGFNPATGRIDFGQAFSAVPMHPEYYAIVFTAGYQAVKSANSDAAVITGGHISGPGRGPVYIRRAMERMPNGVKPDGIALHPYGRGAPGGREDFKPFGSIDVSIEDYKNAMPGHPLWITEWGVLGPGNSPPPVPVEDITDYASRFVTHVNTRHRGDVAATVWFAWADTMHNGFGFVNQNGQEKPGLLNKYKQL